MSLIRGDALTIPLRYEIVRRLGYASLHFAVVNPDGLYEGTVFGTTATLVRSPVLTLCGAELRGDVVRMAPGQTVHCRACLRAIAAPTRLTDDEREVVETFRRLGDDMTDNLIAIIDRLTNP